MQFRAIELLLHGKFTSRNAPTRILVLPFFVFLILLPLPFIRNSNQSSSSPAKSSSLSSNSSSTEMTNRPCDIFSGKWVPYPKGPYYNNETCNLIIDQQNCLKFGRADREYLHWRWRPDECELPLFDATQFLKLVRGKSMAFVGDSVGLNQMLSLLCLLSAVSHPKEMPPLRNTSDHKYFKRWVFADYSFTLANLWSPYLITSRDNDHIVHSSNSLMNIYVDEPDESWTTDIKNFDYVIISAGHWFFRPLMYHENGQIIGCHECHMKNTTDLTNYYGYKMAFRTAFRTLLNLEGYKGVTILRTFSPSHFENGEWNKGGSCVRTTPFSKEDMRLDGYVLETYLTQVEEFRAAEKKGRKKGLKFWLMDTTELMLLRPDGHPNNLGRSEDKNVTINDCVHWCVPGPVDTWNEFLLHMLTMDSQKSSSWTL